jgi:hypothetical protein
MTAGKSEVMLSLAMTLDQRNPVNFKKKDGSSVAHGDQRSLSGRMNSVSKMILALLSAWIARERAGILTP